MNTLVFDIETVPDVELGRRLYELDGLDDASVAQAMCGRLAHAEGRGRPFSSRLISTDSTAWNRSEGAFAKLCGVCPIPASSGVTHRLRLFRGGRHQANTARYHIVTVRMQWHQPMVDYGARRTLSASANETSSGV